MRRHDSALLLPVDGTPLPADGTPLPADGTPLSADGTPLQAVVTSRCSTGGTAVLTCGPVDQNLDLVGWEKGPTIYNAIFSDIDTSKDTLK